ncbi:MAG: 50S ribosomal protein L21 [Clostridiales bacterium]|nr:50S ribosomal protein L21 [Clostridiales bacterium]
MEEKPLRFRPESETPREAGADILKYAIIETGGKQYRVAEGDLIFIEKLNVDGGNAYTFDRILAVIDEDGSKFGSPYLEGAKVEANIVKNGKAKKIRVYKMHPKKGYRLTKGHRQPYTQVQIGSITA